MFYRIRNNVLVDFSDVKYANDCLYTDIITQEQLSNDIEQIQIYNEQIILNPNYEEIKQRKDKERIQELSMTRSDFFDGTIMAWGIGQDELLVLIQGLLATLPIEDVKKLIAINNFKNALNFYRKHDLFKILVNIPIKLTETIQVILTEESLDKFFDEVDKGNKDIAWQYLPQPELIEQEAEDDTKDIVESTDIQI